MAGSDNKLYFEGVVKESCKGLFKVVCAHDGGTETTIQATLSGAIKMNSVKVLVGDKVRVETSPYDPQKGHIVHRFKEDRRNFQEQE